MKYLAVQMRISASMAGFVSGLFFLTMLSPQAATGILGRSKVLFRYWT
ncbi:hypothetical protein [Agrobacterium rosae]|nr:hypothetical protein [Agrobacterium rosae]